MEWVGDFQSFKINDLEMVAQILISWNLVASWLAQRDSLRNAAGRLTGYFGLSRKPFLSNSTMRLES